MLDVFAADLAQAADLHARNLPRPEQGISGRSADTEFSGELVRAQESFGFFSLWARKYPITSVAARLPPHLVTGSCPRAARVVPLRLPRPYTCCPGRVR
jgi:hypothetical protein